MDNIHEILDTVKLTNDMSVLATVIEVEGSAYRKEGTTMLFLEDGKQMGIISAGCLEADLAIQASNLLHQDSTHSQTISYDMSSEDDLSWGRGAGCNGKVHILLEKVDTALRKQLCTVKDYLDQGKPVNALKILKNDSSTIRTFYVTDDEHIFGHENAISKQVTRIAQQVPSSRVQYMEDIKENIYIHHFRPKPRLFIFGAGPDVRPFSSMAAKTGFAVNIWDWRPAFLKQALFTEAHCIQDLPISETLIKANFISSDSVIIMTHDFQKDKEILHFLLEYKQISYLGILGPRQRTSRLLNGAAIPEQLHSPVGLSIGANGPEEIAISIIADLIQTQRQFSGEQRRLTFVEKKGNNRYLSGGGEK